MSTIERAIEIAAEAHAGQRDKAGEPYIFHALRVMMGLESLEERIVGVLHDVVEDSPAWDLRALKAEGFSDEILAAIDALTRREREDYEAFVLRAGANALARRVKLVDLADNMRLSRIKSPSASDHERIKRYERAKALLLAWPRND